MVEDSFVGVGIDGRSSNLRADVQTPRIDGCAITETIHDSTSTADCTPPRSGVSAGAPNGVNRRFGFDSDALGQCTVLWPIEWEAMLVEGQLHTALLLSTCFSIKYRGADMLPGDQADIRLPEAGQRQRTWSPTLLHRSGSREAVAFIWLGDAAKGDETVYIAFAPLLKARQCWKIYYDSEPVQEVFFEPNGGGPVALLMSSYVARKLRKIWQGANTGTGRGELCAQLQDTLNRYPGYRVVFSGISHGAVMAQAAALKFSSMCDSSVQRRIHVASWNPYKWTDHLGACLVERHFGERLLNLVMSREEPPGSRYWDSVSGYPPGYGWAAPPCPRLFDADTGDLLPVPEGDHTFGQDGSFVDFREALELHFAPVAIRAMRLAMDKALGNVTSHAADSLSGIDSSDPCSEDIFDDRTEYSLLLDFVTFAFGNGEYIIHGPDGNPIRRMPAVSGTKNREVWCLPM